MKIKKHTNGKLLTTLILLSFFSLSVFTACNNAKEDYKSISEIEKEKRAELDNWAKKALDNGSFDERIEVLTEYTALNDFTNELAVKLSAELRKDAEEEFKNGNLKQAYEMAGKIFTGMALQENIGLLAKTAKVYSKASFESRDYTAAADSAAKVLQLYWDEEAMDMKLAAEFELLKINLENNIPEAQKYYDDIMDITGLAGNENLAKKYRDNTKKYSDKFPQSKFK